MPMMTTTMSSSMRVKPLRLRSMFAPSWGGDRPQAIRGNPLFCNRRTKAQHAHKSLQLHGFQKYKLNGAHAYCRFLHGSPAHCETADPQKQRAGSEDPALC